MNYNGRGEVILQIACAVILNCIYKNYVRKLVFDCGIPKILKFVLELYSTVQYSTVVQYH